MQYTDKPYTSIPLDHVPRPPLPRLTPRPQLAPRPRLVPRLSVPPPLPVLVLSLPHPRPRPRPRGVTFSLSSLLLLATVRSDDGEAGRLRENGVYSPLKNASSFKFMASGVPTSATTPS